MYNGPQLGIFNEVPGQPEMVIDGITTKDIQINYPEILTAIYDVKGGRVPQFADGKYPGGIDASNLGSGGGYLGSMWDKEQNNVLKELVLAMNEMKNMKVYTTIEDIRKGDKNYTNIENTRGL